MKQLSFGLLLFLSACATGSQFKTAYGDFGKMNRHPADAKFATSGMLIDEMETREWQFYASQRRVFARMAAEIYQTEAHANLPAQPYFHRPDLFDTTSYATVTLDPLGRQLKVTATEKYLDESVNSEETKRIQLGSKYQYSDQEEKALFAEVEYPPVDIVGGVSMENIARDGLVAVRKVLGHDSYFRVISESNLISGTRKVVIDREPVSVSAASQVLELAGGEVCRLSDWMVEMDRKWTLLCLKDTGLLSRPRLKGRFNTID